jgi:hypothetical protein
MQNLKTGRRRVAVRFINLQKRDYELRASGMGLSLFDWIRLSLRQIAGFN